MAAVDPPYEILEHPADVGFRAWGATREALFENAARAMMALACDPDSVVEREAREIAAAGGDDEALLFAWLAEILAVQDAERMFFCRAQVTQLQPGRVCGRVYGERRDRQRHRAGTYIKAVTMHQLLLERAPEGWRAQVYLDV